METGVLLIYDGTFEGMLTCISLALKQQISVSGITAESRSQNGLFTTLRKVPTHRGNAQKLWEELGRKRPGLKRLVYFSYLSQNKDIENTIFNYLNFLFNNSVGDIEERRRLSNQLSVWADQVENEKSSLEFHLDFTPSRDGAPCGLIAPKYDVLPLLTRYCRQRFGSSSWILFDTGRQYGLSCRDGAISFIRQPPRCSQLESAATESQSRIALGRGTRTFRAAV